jgi:hypothetical protein
MKNILDMDFTDGHILGNMDYVILCREATRVKKLLDKDFTD